MARVYTQEEKKFFFLQQVANGLSGRQTCDYFAVEFPDRPKPSLSTVQRVINDFHTRGSIDGHSDVPKKVRAKTVLTEETQTLICAEVENQPHSSTRQIASNLSISQTSVLQVLHENRYKPYKIRHGQILTDNDKQRRYEMSMLLIEEQERDETFFGNILFSDECTFVLDGKRNVQMHRTWARENPYVLVPTNNQWPEKLNVWCGMLNDKIIGPFFIDGNLTADKYMNMLTTQIRPAIDAAVGADRAVHVVYHQDGAGPHTAIRVRELLNDMFNRRWIGKFSPFIEWSPRSPDQNPLDYFLWGYTKSKLYKYERIQNLEELRAKITEIITNIPPNILQKVVTTEFEQRLRCCIAAEGDLFEYQYR